jgi:hypothetical protein
VGHRARLRDPSPVRCGVCPRPPRVARPVFYKGEQIGERRHYDERLAMFLLRYRDPVRYGAWRDGAVAEQHPEGAAVILSKALNQVMMDAGDPDASAGASPRPLLAPLRILYPDDDPDPDHDADYYKPATEEEIVAELRKLNIPGVSDIGLEDHSDEDVP